MWIFSKKSKTEIEIEELLLKFLKGGFYEMAKAQAKYMSEETIRRDRIQRIVRMKETCLFLKHRIDSGEELNEKDASEYKYCNFFTNINPL